MDVFKSIQEFINQVVEFFHNLPNILDDLMARLVSWSIVQYFEAKKQTIEFFYYHVGKPVISSLDIGDKISSAFSSIDPQILATFNYLHVVQAINIILAAYVTRFVLNLIPGV